MPNEPSATDLLKEFCDDVDATGGVTRNDDGVATLMCDAWPDLAAVYLKACRLLGRAPVWN